MKRPARTIKPAAGRSTITPAAAKQAARAASERPAPALPRVVWFGDWPPEVRAALEPDLAAALPMLPRWCAEFTVTYVDDEEAPASVGTEPEYRLASLRVGPSWIANTPKGRADVLLHEVLHVSIEPVANVIEDVLTATDAPDPLAKWAREQIRRAVEGAVCDLTAAIGRARKPAA